MNMPGPADEYNPYSYLFKDCKIIEDVQKFACKICVKDWHLDYEEMLVRL